MEAELKEDLAQWPENSSQEGGLRGRQAGGRGRKYF